MEHAHAHLDSGRMITLQAVSKTHSDRPSCVEALKNIDLTVRPGEFISIMGLSGSGKSTLLNLVSALDAPSSRSIVIHGSDISQFDDDALTPLRRRKIGLTVQFFQRIDRVEAPAAELLVERCAR